MFDPMLIEIWADVICPWCWIGQKRFERALDDFPDRDQVRIVWRSFRLMPGRLPQPIEATLNASAPGKRAGAMLRHIESTAQEEGLEYRLGGMQVGDTMSAHRLLYLAQELGRFQQLQQLFCRAGLTEGVSLLNPSNLLQMAVQAGIRRERALQVLESSEYRGAVEMDEARARKARAQSVPFFLFSGRYALEGAQMPEDFSTALRQAWMSASSSSRVDFDDNSLTVDGLFINDW